MTPAELQRIAGYGADHESYVFETALGIPMMLFWARLRCMRRVMAPHYRGFTFKPVKMVLNNHGFTLSKAIVSAF